MPGTPEQLPIPKHLSRCFHSLRGPHTACCAEQGWSPHLVPILRIDQQGWGAHSVQQGLKERTLNPVSQMRTGRAAALRGHGAGVGTEASPFIWKVAFHKKASGHGKDDNTSSVRRHFISAFALITIEGASLPSHPSFLCLTAHA